MKVYVVLAVAVICSAASAAFAQQQRATGSKQDSSVILVQKIQSLTDEVQGLRTEIAEQRGELAVLTKQRDSGATSFLAASGVVLAAIVAGIVAIVSQRRQAKEGRLLRAVELIMQSKNGYQAELRARNLAMFLDSTARANLENIRKEFSGDEYTDLQVSLAQAMSEKATNAGEVLRIWQAVISNKRAVGEAKYP